MIDKFTAKNFNILKAPAKISLLGDKTKRPESAQHIIEFPGGAIEVSRTTEGHYWAHIIVNRKQAYGDESGLVSAIGQVIDSRYANSEEIKSLPEETDICQISVLIKSIKVRSGTFAKDLKEKP